MLIWVFVDIYDTEICCLSLFVQQDVVTVFLASFLSVQSVTADADKHVGMHCLDTLRLVSQRHIPKNAFGSEGNLDS